MAENLEPHRSLPEQPPPGAAARRLPIPAVVLPAMLLVGLLLVGLWGLWAAQPAPLGYDGMEGVPAPHSVSSSGQSQPNGMARQPLGIPLPPTLPANLPPPLVQTHNGYTIAIQPLAADANQVVISYTISVDPVPAGTPAAVLVVALHDSSGAPLLLLNPPGIARPGYPQRLLFDAGGRTDLPAAWSLHLTLTLEQPPVYTPALPPPPPTGVIMGLPPFTPLPTQPRVVPPTPTAPRDPLYPAISPPFQFAFTVPTDRRVRTAALQRTLTVQGVALTLEQVSVTAAQARVVLRPSVPDEPQASVDLLNLQMDWVGKAADTPRLPFSTGSPHLAADGTFIWFQPAALLQQNDTWVLIVAAVTVVHNKPLIPADAVAGPWTFRFVVPALILPPPTE